MSKISGGSYSAGFNPKLAYQLCLKQHPNSCKLKWFQDEKPIREIFINSFYIDQFEVTQKEYSKIMGQNPSSVIGDNLPVHNVTWHESNEYCQKLNKRLPTEAEWEKAAKGGTDFIFSWGNEMISGRANFCDKTCPKRWKEGNFNDGFAHVAPVGTFPPNKFDLYDMAGNVYEWVEDWYSEDSYNNRPTKNPLGPKKGSYKVIRGGSWINYSVGTRPTDRTDTKPNERLDFVGFRCAKSITKKDQ